MNNQSEKVCENMVCALCKKPQCLMLDEYPYVCGSKKAEEAQPQFCHGHKPVEVGKCETCQKEKCNQKMPDGSSCLMGLCHGHPIPQPMQPNTEQTKGEENLREKVEKIIIGDLAPDGILTDEGTRKVHLIMSLLSQARTQALRDALAAVENGVPQPRWDVPDTGSVMPDDPAIASDQTLIYAKRKAIAAIRSLLNE